MLLRKKNKYFFNLHNYFHAGLIELAPIVLNFYFSIQIYLLSFRSNFCVVHRDRRPVKAMPPPPQFLKRGEKKKKEKKVSLLALSNKIF